MAETMKQLKTGEPLIPDARRIGALYMLRDQLRGLIRLDGVTRELFGDAVAGEPTEFGRVPVQQEGGRREHYDFWTGIEQAVRACEVTLQRLEARSTTEKPQVGSTEED